MWKCECKAVCTCELWAAHHLRLRKMFCMTGCAWLRVKRLGGPMCDTVSYIRGTLGVCPCCYCTCMCERACVWPECTWRGRIIACRSSACCSYTLRLLGYLTEGIFLHVTPQKTYVPARPVADDWASSEVTHSPKELSECCLWKIGLPWLGTEVPLEL